MPPQDATENRVADALLTALRAIGTPQSAWLTNPYPVVEGVPNQDVGQLDRPRLLLNYRNTTQRDGEAGTSRHGMRVLFSLWCIAADVRTLCKLKADCLRTIYANETTIAATLQEPAWAHDFHHRDEMSTAGARVGELIVYLETTVEHGAP